MKNQFKRLTLEIIAFDIDDIVTSSLGGGNGGDPEFTPGENEGPFVPA